MNTDPLTSRARESRKFQVQSQHYAAVRTAISQDSQFGSSFVIMNALAAAVASYGLLANSTAVVIGAMVIATLLGPIMGLALALVDGDKALFQRSLAAESAGAILVLLVGLIIGRLHFDIPITVEILSRTQPNLLDLAIAVFGGAAGAYATVSPKVAVGLVGVAVATALVPPLAACGICLSRGLLTQANGAFILFITNLVAIQCASSFVLFVLGYHDVTHEQTGRNGMWRRVLINAAIFVLLAIFLTVQLFRTVAQKQFEQAISSQLRRGLSVIPGAYLAETRFLSRADKDIVVAVVRVPMSITPAQTGRLQTHLKNRGKRQIELHVRSLLTKESTADGYLHETNPRAEPIESLETDVPDSTVLETDGLSSGGGP